MCKVQSVHITWSENTVYEGNMNVLAGIAFSAPGELWSKESVPQRRRESAGKCCKQSVSLYYISELKKELNRLQHLSWIFFSSSKD